jgi:hypothetical protein
MPLVELLFLASSQPTAGDAPRFPLVLSSYTASLVTAALSPHLSELLPPALTVPPGPFPAAALSPTDLTTASSAVFRRLPVSQLLPLVEVLADALPSLVAELVAATAADAADAPFSPIPVAQLLQCLERAAVSVVAAPGCKEAHVPRVAISTFSATLAALVTAAAALAPVQLSLARMAVKAANVTTATLAFFAHENDVPLAHPAVPSPAATARSELGSLTAEEQGLSVSGSAGASAAVAGAGGATSSYRRETQVLDAFVALIKSVTALLCVCTDAEACTAATYISATADVLSAQRVLNDRAALATDACAAVTFVLDTAASLYAAGAPAIPALTSVQTALKLADRGVESSLLEDSVLTLCDALSAALEGDAAAIAAATASGDAEVMASLVPLLLIQPSSSAALPALFRLALTVPTLVLPSVAANQAPHAVGSPKPPAGLLRLLTAIDLVTHASMQLLAVTHATATSDAAVTATPTIATLRILSAGVWLAFDAPVTTLLAAVSTVTRLRFWPEAPVEHPSSTIAAGIPLSETSGALAALQIALATPGSMRAALSSLEPALEIIALMQYAGSQITPHPADARYSTALLLARSLFGTALSALSATVPVPGVASETLHAAFVTGAAPRELAELIASRVVLPLLTGAAPSLPGVPAGTTPPTGPSRPEGLEDVLLPATASLLAQAVSQDPAGPGVGISRVLLAEAGVLHTRRLVAWIDGTARAAKEGHISIESASDALLLLLAALAPVLNAAGAVALSQGPEADSVSSLAIVAGGRQRRASAPQGVSPSCLVDRTRLVFALAASGIPEVASAALELLPGSPEDRHDLAVAVLLSGYPPAGEANADAAAATPGLALFPNIDPASSVCAVAVSYVSYARLSGPETPTARRTAVLNAAASLCGATEADVARDASGRFCLSPHQESAAAGLAALCLEVATSHGSDFRETTRLFAGDLLAPVGLALHLSRLPEVTSWRLLLAILPVLPPAAHRYAHLLNELSATVVSLSDGVDAAASQAAIPGHEEALDLAIHATSFLAAFCPVLTTAEVVEPSKAADVALSAACARLVSATVLFCACTASEASLPVFTSLLEEVTERLPGPELTARLLEGVLSALQQPVPAAFWHMGPNVSVRCTLTGVRVRPAAALPQPGTQSTLASAVALPAIATDATGAATAGQFAGVTPPGPSSANGTPAEHEPQHKQLPGLTLSTWVRLSTALPHSCFAGSGVCPLLTLMAPGHAATAALGLERDPSGPDAYRVVYAVTRDGAVTLRLAAGPSILPALACLPSEPVTTGVSVASSSPIATAGSLQGLLDSHMQHNGWFHVCVTHTATGSVGIHLNGRLVARHTFDPATTVNDTSDLRLPPVLGGNEEDLSTLDEVDDQVPASAVAARSVDEWVVRVGFSTGQEVPPGQDALPLCIGPSTVLSAAASDAETRSMRLAPNAVLVTLAGRVIAMMDPSFEHGRPQRTIDGTSRAVAVYVAPPEAIDDSCLDGDDEAPFGAGTDFARVVNAPPPTAKLVAPSVAGVGVYKLRHKAVAAVRSASLLARLAAVSLRLLTTASPAQRAAAVAVTAVLWPALPPSPGQTPTDTLLAAGWAASQLTEEQNLHLEASRKFWSDSLPRALLQGSESHPAGQLGLDASELSRASFSQIDAVEDAFDPTTSPLHLAPQTLSGLPLTALAAAVAVSSPLHLRAAVVRPEASLMLLGLSRVIKHSPPGALAASDIANCLSTFYRLVATYGRAAWPALASSSAHPASNIQVACGMLRSLVAAAAAEAASAVIVDRPEQFCDCYISSAAVKPFSCQVLADSHVTAVYEAVLRTVLGSGAVGLLQSLVSHVCTDADVRVLLGELSLQVVAQAFVTVPAAPTPSGRNAPTAAAASGAVLMDVSCIHHEVVLSALADAILRAHADQNRLYKLLHACVKAGAPDASVRLLLTGGSSSITSDPSPASSAACTPALVCKGPVELPVGLTHVVAPGPLQMRREIDHIALLIAALGCGSSGVALVTTDSYAISLRHPKSHVTLAMVDGLRARLRERLVTAAREVSAAIKTGHRALPPYAGAPGDILAAAAEPLVRMQLFTPASTWLLFSAAVGLTLPGPPMDAPRLLDARLRASADPVEAAADPDAPFDLDTDHRPTIVSVASLLPKHPFFLSPQLASVLPQSAVFAPWAEASTIASMASAQAARASASLLAGARMVGAAPFELRLPELLPLALSAAHSRPDQSEYLPPSPLVAVAVPPSTRADDVAAGLEAVIVRGLTPALSDLFATAPPVSLSLLRALAGPEPTSEEEFRARRPAILWASGLAARILLSQMTDSAAAAVRAGAESAAQASKYTFATAEVLAGSAPAAAVKRFRSALGDAYRPLSTSDLALVDAVVPSARSVESATALRASGRIASPLAATRAAAASYEKNVGCPVWTSNLALLFVSRPTFQLLLFSQLLSWYRSHLALRTCVGLALTGGAAPASQCPPSKPLPARALKRAKADLATAVCSVLSHLVFLLDGAGYLPGSSQLHRSLLPGFDSYAEVAGLVADVAAAKGLDIVLRDDLPAEDELSTRFYVHPDVAVRLILRSAAVATGLAALGIRALTACLLASAATTDASGLSKGGRLAATRALVFSHRYTLFADDHDREAFIAAGGIPLLLLCVVSDDAEAVRRVTKRTDASAEPHEEDDLAPVPPALSAKAAKKAVKAARKEAKKATADAVADRFRDAPARTSKFDALLDQLEAANGPFPEFVSSSAAILDLLRHRLCAGKAGRATLERLLDNDTRCLSRLAPNDLGCNSEVDFLVRFALWIRHSHQAAIRRGIVARCREVVIAQTAVRDAVVREADDIVLVARM